MAFGLLGDFQDVAADQPSLVQSVAVGPNGQMDRATGKEMTQGIYNAFRKLGYTDFGAKTMLAEIRREHGGEFSMEGGSRRPFGFEQEPANPNQVNFGFINSTGQRTKDILGHLEKEGLISYDAPKTRLNPTGIKVENSQRALDAMAAWYDKDLREKGARDPHAIINGADPRQLPDLFRDPNYKDVTDAHRRTAAYIQWQHPEIYGGKYRYGIAGERHYNNMMADRGTLDKIIDPNGEFASAIPKDVAKAYTDQDNIYGYGGDTGEKKLPMGLPEAPPQVPALATPGADTPPAYAAAPAAPEAPPGTQDLMSGFQSLADGLSGADPATKRMMEASQKSAAAGMVQAPAPRVDMTKLAALIQKLNGQPLGANVGGGLGTMQQDQQALLGNNYFGSIG